MATNDTLFLDTPEKCGLGEGETCCAFLSMSGGGFACGRTIPGLEAHVRQRLLEGTMKAKGDPGDAPYPECQRARKGLEPA